MNKVDTGFFSLRVYIFVGTYRWISVIIQVNYLIVRIQTTTSWLAITANVLPCYVMQVQSDFFLSLTILLITIDCFP